MKNINAILLTFMLLVPTLSVRAQEIIRDESGIPGIGGEKADGSFKSFKVNDDGTFPTAPAPGSGPTTVVGAAGAELSKEAKQDDQITELQAILAKILAAPSTEAKQDALNALIVIIDAVLDAIKLDTVNISSDQATETTSAAILAKILVAPSTEAKQDNLNALIVIIDAVLDAIKLDTANISSDQATQTTLAAILAKIIAAPATEAKQDTGNTSLATIAGVDFATQTTLAAVLAKIIAAPATEAKQDTGNTSLASIDGKDFATQTTLAAVLAKIIAAPSTEAKQDSNITNTTEIELNTDSPTTFTFGTVSVTSTATQLRAATPGARSFLVHNTAGNTVVFVGGAGVTTATGVPIASSGGSGANGNGGTVIYTHTAAIFGIVASGTADIRFQGEAD